MEDKKFMTTLKAIMYQLFSRKLNMVVFTGDPNTSHQWLFSNVESETMLVYDDSSEYHFAKVELKDTEFLDEFYKRFPLLKQHGSIIHVVDFCAPLSKVDDLSKCILSAEGDALYMNWAETSLQDEGLENKMTKQVGNIIPNIEVDMYYSIWSSGLVGSEDPFKTTFKASDIVDVDNKVVVVQDIANPTEKFHAQHAMIIIQPGYTVPTLPAFLKVMKNESDTFELVAGYDKNSVIVNCIYDTTVLKSIGTHPAQRWFVKDKR